MNKDPLILAVAPNGARKQRDDHAMLPLTLEEITDTAVTCRDAGANMLHLHVRDNKGKHTLDAGRYRETLQALAASLGEDYPLQVTTEAAGIYAAEQQVALVETLKPEFLSVSLREIARLETGEHGVRRFFAMLFEYCLSPQVILYDVDDVRLFSRYLETGVIGSRKLTVLLVIGRFGSEHDGQHALRTMLQELPQGLQWMVCAFGRDEFPLTSLAMTLGGHVRVGFENNLRLRDGTLAADNAVLVRQSKEVAIDSGRHLASPLEAGELLRGGGSHGD